MNISRCIVLLFSCCIHVQNSYGKFNILGIMPHNGKSHFNFAEVLFEALAQHGHNVTVLSHFPKKIPIKNYHDISISTEENTGIHRIRIQDVSHKSELSIIIGLFEHGLQKICREGLSHKNVQKLLKSKDHYDIIITEFFNADCFLGFVHKFKAPLVVISSSSLFTWLSDRTGNPENPSFVPGTTSGNPSRMSFLKRFKNTIHYVIYKLIYWFYNKQCEVIARQHFGADMPSLQDIGKNASLFLINSHFTYQLAKPLLPNIKEIAGAHVKNPRPLPQDLENWISGATHGLIYFNLGSMLRTSTIDEVKRKAFFESFAQLPFRVLMKWETEESLAGLPDNVKLTTWSPQNDVLHHPNVKLFITHGGMLGTVEAVHAGVPMIVIPFYGDQWTNAMLVSDKGLGIVLHYVDISYETLNRTLHNVIYDPGYARRAKELSAAFRDRPISPLEESVYWIEYVGRHKGSAVQAALRSPVHDLALHEYLLFDVLAVFILGIVGICYSIRLLVRLIMKLKTKLAPQRSISKLKNN